MWKRIISRCSDSSVRTEFSLEFMEKSILSDRSRSGGVSVSHLRIPQKSPVSGEFAAGSRSILGILGIESERENILGVHNVGSCRINPAVYVRARLSLSISRRYVTSGVRLGESRGRPQRGSQALANTIGGWCQFCRFLRQTIPKFLLIARKRLPSIGRKARIPIYRRRHRVCWLADFFSPKIPLADARISVAGNSIFSISLARYSE